MRDKTIADILGDLAPEDQDAAASKKGTPLTLWVSEELKAEYDEVQQIYRKRFSKRLVELVKVAVKEAKKRAS